MSKSLGAALAAYLALWAAVAGGIIYGIVRAASPCWVAVPGSFLLLVVENRSMAHRARVRQLRAEGQEPPPYLRYLFFPQGLPRFKEKAHRFEHLVVGIGATLTGVFLVFCGVALAFDAGWSRISQPLLAAAICIV